MVLCVKYKAIVNQDSVYNTKTIILSIIPCCMKLPLFGDGGRSSGELSAATAEWVLCSFVCSKAEADSTVEELTCEGKISLNG